MQHLFTVDFEDWYCAGTISTIIKRSDWASCESRLSIGGQILFDILDRKGISATFFVLGCIAEREPELVREIVGRGHEIATHGYGHRSLDDLLPREFRHDLELSIEVIERITGVVPRGFRAPNFSLTERTAEYAVDIINDCNLTYDSSIFPSPYHPLFHYSRHKLEFSYLAKGLLEAPISCADIGRFRLPATGGAYFRHLPFALSSELIFQCEQQGRPAMFYIHPWELDRNQPRIGLGFIQKIRHYRGIGSMAGKLERLLDRFNFTSIRDYLAARDLPPRTGPGEGEFTWDSALENIHATEPILTSPDDDSGENTMSIHV